MEIRSLVVLRRASDFYYVKVSGRAKSPDVYESSLIEIAKSHGREYLGFVGEWKGNKTKVLMKCENGHYFVATVHCFCIADRGCKKCVDASIRFTEADALARAREEAHKRGDCEVVGFDGGYKLSGVKNLIIRCLKHGEYKISLNNFLCGRGCPTCKLTNAADRVRKAEEDALTDVREKAVEYGECEIVGFENGYISAKTKNLLVKCFEHGLYRTSSDLFLNSGRGCSLCPCGGFKFDKPGYIYVQKLSGELDAIKFGISNSLPKNRMKAQQYLSVLNHELVFSWFFDKGASAFEVERQIKKKYKGLTKFVPREMMKDGYTETLPGEIMPVFLKEVKSLCNLHR